jgi:Fe-S-cluster containining protein
MLLPALPGESGFNIRVTFIKIPTKNYSESDPPERIRLTVEQDCIQCGICCERWGWNQKGIIEDIIPWIVQDRKDILRHVGIRFSDGRKASGAELSERDLDRISRIYYWQDPDGKPMRKCPFFRRSEDGKAWCGIHTVKPRVCREFTPWNWMNLEYYGSCPACREKAP